MASASSFPIKNDVYFELDNRSKEYYKPGESISGQLVIAVNSPLEVQILAVSLEALSQSCIIDKDNQQEKESHYLIYQLFTIDPRSEITKTATAIAGSTPEIAPHTADPSVPSSVPSYQATTIPSQAEPITSTSDTNTTTPSVSTAPTPSTEPSFIAAPIPSATSAERGIFSSTKSSFLSSRKSKSESLPTATILSSGYHRFKFQLELPFKNHCYVSSASNHISAEQELHNHVSRYLPSSLPLSENPLSDTGSNFVNYYFKSIIKRNRNDSSKDIVTFQTIQVRSTVELKKERQYEFSLQKQTILKVPGFDVEVPIFLNLSKSSPDLIIVESYSSDSQSISFDFKELELQIFATLNIPQLVKVGSPIASKIIRLDIAKLELMSNFKALAGVKHSNKFRSLCVLPTNNCGIEFPMNTFQNGEKNGNVCFSNSQVLTIPKFDNICLSGNTKLIESFTTCNLKQEYFVDITISAKFVSSENTQVPVETNAVSLVVSLPVELYYKSSIEASNELNDHNEADYVFYNNSRLYFQNESPVMSNKLNHRITEYEGVASDISETLSGKLNKLSMRIGKENPKLGNKISHFVNEGNSFIQQKLGNNTVTTSSSQSMFDNKIQGSSTNQQTPPAHSANYTSPAVTTATDTSAEAGSNMTPTSTLSSETPQPGPSVSQEQWQIPAYHDTASTLLESGQPATGDIKESNAGSFSIQNAAVGGTFADDAGPSSSIGVAATNSEADLPPPPSYDDSLHDSINDIKQNSAK